MKKALFTAAAFLSLQAHAQLPYFLQEHQGNNIFYGSPVDIEFDGMSTVYSLHFSSSHPGVITAKYNAATGAISNVSYLTRGTAPLKPVRVRTLGTNYYVLFNSVSPAGVAGYCLVSLDAATNAVNWAQAYFPPAGNTRRHAVDFILDGGTSAYILSSVYDAANNQMDVGITKTDFSGPPTLIWDNVYQNTARNEDPANIVYRSASNELIVSAVSTDLINPTGLDRGPVVMRVATTGLYTASMLYEYNPGCNHAEPNGTWVTLGPTNFYLSSTSIEGGVNGPVWLSRINPATLGIMLQSNHKTGTVYFKPEMNLVLTAAGGQVLISGSSSALTDYVHQGFNTTALALVQGVRYPVTNALDYTPIYNTYIATGAGMNIFSVAENAATLGRYYLLKTSDIGHNDCEDPYVVTPDPCTMGAIPIAFTQVPGTIATALPPCSAVDMSNSFIQPCFVPLFAPLVAEREGQSVPMQGNLLVSPNPSKGIFTISAGKGIVSDIQITNTDGKTVNAEINKLNGELQVNLTGNKAGMYVIRVLVDGEPKNVKLVLE